MPDMVKLYESSGSTTGSLAIIMMDAILPKPNYPVMLYVCLPYDCSVGLIVTVCAAEQASGFMICLVASKRQAL